MFVALRNYFFGGL